MSIRKQLLVLSTTVPLLMFGATVGMAAQENFSICTFLKGTGAGYGLCRAGVAVGCADPDGTGNAQACENIEYHFLTVTGDLVPWLDPPDACPCNFEAVDKASPPDGPWGGSEESRIVCQDAFDEDDAFRYREVAERGDGPRTVLQAGEDLYLDDLLFCIVSEEEEPPEIISGLSEAERNDCISKLDAYWAGLMDSIRDGTIVGTPDQACEL